jgi:hypothetical protein
VSKRAVLVLSIVFLIALPVLFLFWLTRPANPTYHGKHLSEWLDDLDIGPFGTPAIPGTVAEQRYDRALKVVHEIGEAAVPYLLHLLEQRDSSLKLKLVSLARKQNVIPINFRNQQQREWVVSEGSSLLPQRERLPFPA